MLDDLVSSVFELNFLYFQVNIALDDLVSSVTELNDLYEETTSGSGQQLLEPKLPVFLSQIDLDSFFKVEEKFTSELTAFTKKQFFEVCFSKPVLLQSHSFVSPAVLKAW